MKSNKPTASNRATSAKSFTHSGQPAKKPFLVKGQGKTIGTVKQRLKQKQEEPKEEMKAPTLHSQASESDLSREVNSKPTSIHQRARSTILKTKHSDSDIDRDTTRKNSQYSDKDLQDIVVNTELLSRQEVAHNDTQQQHLTNLECDPQLELTGGSGNHTSRRPRSTRGGSKSGFTQPSSNQNLNGSISNKNLNQVENMIKIQQPHENIIVKNLFSKENLQNNIDQILESSKSNVIHLQPVLDSSSIKDSNQSARMGRLAALPSELYADQPMPVAPNVTENCTTDEDAKANGQYVAMFGELSKKLILNESPAYYLTTDKKDAVTQRKMATVAEETSPQILRYSELLNDAQDPFLKASEQQSILLKSEENYNNNLTTGIADTSDRGILIDNDEEIEPQLEYVKPSEQYARKSISDFLNQRINLSSVSMKNTWLNQSILKKRQTDVKAGVNQTSEDQPRSNLYSLQNKSKLEAIDKELNKKKSQFMVSSQITPSNVSKNSSFRNDGYQQQVQVIDCLSINESEPTITKNPSGRLQTSTNENTLKQSQSNSSLKPMTKIQLNLQTRQTHSGRKSSEELKQAVPIMKSKIQSEHKKNSKSVGGSHQPSRTNTPLLDKRTPKTFTASQKPKLKNCYPTQHFQSETPPQSKKQLPQESIQPKVSHFRKGETPQYDLPLTKHIKGVEVIMESEPILEYSQKIDFNAALKNQLSSRYERQDTQRNDENIPEETQKNIYDLPRQMPAKGAIKQPTHVRNNSAALIGTASRVMRQKSAGKLVHKATPRQDSNAVKTESKANHQRNKTELNPEFSHLDISKPVQTELVDSEVDLAFYSKPNTQAGSENMKPRLTMEDLQKQYQTKVECYQDFYHNVQSYSQYDSRRHYQDFVARKAEQEAEAAAVKKNAIRKTASMFQEAVEGQLRGINSSVVSDRSYELGSQISRMNTSRQPVEQKKKPSVPSRPIATQQSPPPPMKLFPKASSGFTTQRSVKPSPQNTLTSSRFATNVTNKKPLYEQVQAVKTFDPSSRRATPQRSQITPMKKQPVPKKAWETQSHASQISKGSVLKSRPFGGSIMSERVIQTTAKAPGKKAKLTSSKPIESKELASKASSSIQVNAAAPVMTNNQPKPAPQVTKQMKKEALFESLKKEISAAFQLLQIDQGQIWDEKALLQSDSSTFDPKLLSRNEVEKVLTQLSYLTDDLPQVAGSSSPLMDKLKKLETYQFEDLLQTLSCKRYQLPGKRAFVPTLSPSKRVDSGDTGCISVLSLTCFVLAMNDICRDWMLIESKRPKPPPPVEQPPQNDLVPEAKPDRRRMSMMEQKLLGLHFLQEKDRQNERKSILQRKKDEEGKLQKLIQEVQKQQKEREKSSSSSESDGSQEEPQGNYFMLRKKQEIGLLKEQFSYLVQNRAEHQDKLAKQSKQRTPTKKTTAQQASLSKHSTARKGETNANVPLSRNHGCAAKTGTQQIPSTKGLLKQEGAAELLVDGSNTENFGETQEHLFAQHPLEHHRIAIEGLESPMSKKSKNGRMAETLNNRTCDSLPLQMVHTQKLGSKEEVKEPAKGARSAKKPTARMRDRMSPIRPGFNLPKSTSSSHMITPVKAAQSIAKPWQQGSQKAANSKQFTPATKARDNNKAQLHQDGVGKIDKTQKRAQQRHITHDDSQSNKMHATINSHIISKYDEEKEQRLMSSQPECLSRQQSADKRDSDELEEPSPQLLIPQQSRPDYNIQPPQSLSKSTSQHFNNMEMEAKGVRVQQQDQEPKQHLTVNFQNYRSPPKQRSPIKESQPSNIKSIYYEERFNRISDLEIDQRQSSEEIFKYLQEEPFSEDQLRINKDLNESLPITTQNSIGSPLRNSIGLDGNTKSQRLSNLLQQSMPLRQSIPTSIGSDEPILILDIKLIKDKPEKIVVMENDIPEELVEKFCKINPIDNSKKQRLLSVIKQQIKEYYLEQDENSESHGSPLGIKQSEHRISTMMDCDAPNHQKSIEQAVPHQQSQVISGSYNCFEQSQPLTQIDENEENIGNFSEEGEY